MNSKNSGTTYPQRLLLHLADKTNLKRRDKYVALSNLSIHYTWKKVLKSHTKIHSFKIAPTWNEELPDGSKSIRYSRSFEIYNKRKHGEKTDNPSIRTYVNKKLSPAFDA